METESLQRDYHSTETPHFDDERTVLSAQPVVPLEEVKTSRIKRRAVKLIGLFIAAVLLGAFSALVVVSYERLHTARTVSNEAAVEHPPAVVDEQKTEAPTPLETADSEPAPSTPAAATSPKTVAVVREKIKSREREKIEKTDKRQTNRELTENAAPSAQPKAILVDEIRGHWEERRARRVRRQERREGFGPRGRDLRRIDEIFEGRRP
jgi:hypothetical protein